MNMKRFWHKDRNINYLIFTIVGLCGIAWFMNGVSPEAPWGQLFFYVFLGIISFCLGMYILASKKEALLVAIGAIVYFLLRSLNLRHPIYLILLIAVLYSIRVYYNKRD
jgi:FtsH-binding integral membrane protein